MTTPARSFVPGLVSVTFRRLSIQEIVTHAVESGLQSIEWGGDIHVPHGDLAEAKIARQLCRDAGLTISAYGSYYRAWASQKNGVDFADIVATARELGTDSIRVWAGNLGSDTAPPGIREAVIADIKRMCRLAADGDCSISLEFHGGTLTDSAQATRQLIVDVAAPNLSTYWQPPVGMAPAECVASLQAVLPYVRNIHVFHWWPDHHHRLALSDGFDQWREYLKLAADSGKPRHASLEFVRGDDPNQLKDDAKTLLRLLNKVGEV
jgi:3-dehydroshikimate dehydratase